MLVYRKVFCLVIIALVSACASSDQTQPVVGGYKVGTPYQISGVTYTPQVNYAYDESGIASWYGPGFDGRQTANGEIFDEDAMTAAHPTLPMPSVVKVTNLDNNRTAVLRINDRGPFVNNRVIDVSKRAAQVLGFERQGTANVRVQVLAEESRRAALDAGATAGQLASYNAPAQTGGYTMQTQPQAVAMPVPVYQTSPYAVSQSTPKVQVQPLGSAIDTAPAYGSIATTQPVVTNTGTSYGQAAAIAGTARAYYVQAGAFQKADNAHALAQKISQLQTTMVQPISLDGVQYFRVRVGPLATSSEANAVLNQLAAAGYTQSKIMTE